MTSRSEQMGTRPVKKLILEYSIPMVTAMVVNSVYNMVDRVFVGRFVGEAALGGLTLVFPVMMIFMALAQLMGAGAAPLMAIKMGERKPDAAAGIFGTMIIFVTLASAILVPLVWIFAEDILRLFGADKELMVYSLPYLRIILVGTFFQLLAMNLSNTVRVEGRPDLAMKTMVVSAVLNMILDYLFVVRFEWGIRGAAYATIIGQILGFIWLSMFYLRGGSSLGLKPKHFKPVLGIFVSTLGISFSMFIGQFGTAFSMVFLNKFLASYGGNQALSALGGINSLYSLFIMPLIGIMQGVQPVISYNHGAGNRERVREAITFGIILAAGFASVVWLLMELFPHAFLSLFISGESSTMDIAVSGLRIFVLMLPFLGFQFVGNSYFQAVNKSREALFLSSVRQVLLTVPLLYLLAPIFGLTGVWMVTPIGDGIAFVLTLIFLLRAAGKTPSSPVPVVTELCSNEAG